MYAIVLAGGKQYKVQEGATITVDLVAADAGERLGAARLARGLAGGAGAAARSGAVRAGDERAQQRGDIGGLRVLDLDDGDLGRGIGLHVELLDEVLVELHARGIGDEDDLVGALVEVDAGGGGDERGAETCGGAVGTALGGAWSLTVRDRARADVGTLASWSIAVVTGS